MVQLTSRNRYLYLEPGSPPSPWDGSTKTLEEWQNLTGISKQLIRDRINRGWSVRSALLTKARNYRAGKKKARNGEHRSSV